MAGLAALPGCLAAQHDKQPHHGSGTSIVLRQYNFGRGTFSETHRRTFHNTMPDVGFVFFTPLSRFFSFVFVLFFTLHIMSSMCRQGLYAFLSFALFSECYAAVASIKGRVLVSKSDLLWLAHVLCNCGEGQQ